LAFLTGFDVSLGRAVRQSRDIVSCLMHQPTVEGSNFANFFKLGLRNTSTGFEYRLLAVVRVDSVEKMHIVMERCSRPPVGLPNLMVDRAASKGIYMFTHDTKKHLIDIFISYLPTTIILGPVY